ncbi:MAG TPA: transketolase [Verrucomicrobiaceae bacterium]|jgi:transketolase
MSSTSTFDASAARARCRRHRRRVLDISQKVSALHIAPAFSCMELVDTMYYGEMRRGRGRDLDDTFVLSKGHGSMAQYVVLESLGVVATQDLNLYSQPGGRYATHPDYGLPGIEASTGSLGHGLSLAVGMSYADKVRRTDRTVYVVMSDGELQEGSVWEAMMLAPTLKITQLVAAVDLNDFQSLGQTSKMHPNFYPVLDKVRAFGWETVQVDGHDAGAIHDAISSRSGQKPFMLIARTTKGKGVSYMENVPIWHYRSPNPQEYEAAIKEIEASPA